MPENEPVVIQQVCKEFPTRGETLRVLRGVDLTVGRGQSVALMGPSGSGKSTLLHILGALDQPTSGTVRVAGRDPFGLDGACLADFRNSEIGFVFQDHHLLPQCTALENVLVPTLVRREKRSDGADRARLLLERVGLGERLDYLPSELSGGERQRVAIARALVNAPPVLLCDEPTGNLDHATAQSIAECFSALQREERVALVVATHSAQFAETFDRVLELKDGLLIPA